MSSAAHECWFTSISVHVEAADLWAQPASQWLYWGAKEKVTTEIAFQLQALSAGAHASPHTHSASLCDQGAPGRPAGSTYMEKQKISADTPL